MSPRIPDRPKNPARRVFFLLAAALHLGAGLTVVARENIPTARPAPKFLTTDPDAAEGARILSSFRNVGIEGAYWLRFELRVMPRRGAERKLSGHLFGMPGTGGPLTKLTSVDRANTGARNTELLLLRGGADAAAWQWNAGQRGIAPTRLGMGELFEPLQDTDLTPFDLLMPFLRWPDHVYEGVADVRSRPAHAFLLYPPAPLPAPGRGELVPAAIRVFLDTQFGAMTQAEWLDASGTTLKSVTVLDLKKTGGQWIVKTIDLRNHTTRAKTRFAVQAIATGLTLPLWLFDPEQISREEPVVPADRIELL